MTVHPLVPEIYNTQKGRNFSLTMEDDDDDAYYLPCSYIFLFFGVSLLVFSLFFFSSIEADNRFFLQQLSRVLGNSRLNF